MPLVKSARRALFVVGVYVGVFFLFRLLLIGLYANHFHSLSAAEILTAFLRGTLFDLSISLAFIGFPLLFLLLPFRWSTRDWWQGLWTWYCFLVLAIFVFMLGGDLAYFGLAHRHVGPEVTAIGNDLDLIVDMALHNYAGALMTASVAVIALGWWWRRSLKRLPAHPAHPVLTVLAFVAVVVGVRGNVSGKPIGVVDAFADGSASAGYLTLNAPFSVFHSFQGSRPIDVDFLPWDQAVASVRKELIEPTEISTAGYPLQRAQPAEASRHPNVVVLMLESWDAQHVDALRKAMQLPPLGATPNFDALAKQGVLFTQFYANGQRSMDGMSAILAGMPTLPGIPYIGRGMEQSDLGFLGSLAARQGYDTYFLQSAKRRSFRVDAIAARAGFDHYYGAEDIPARDPSLPVTDRGAWDYDTFMFAHQLFSQADKPFVSFIFTATTHGPYDLPGPHWNKFTGDGLKERYLNTLNYADWALGEFFKAARASDYYRNTIFIITGDHVSGFDVDPDDVRTQHHIPCLVIAPGQSPRSVERIGSQLDIIPTIVQLAGWSQPYASLGRSLWDTRAGHGALVVRDEVVSRIDPSGWVEHDMVRRVGARALEKDYDVDAAQRHLLAESQVAITLLRQNRVYRQDKAKDAAVLATRSAP